MSIDLHHSMYALNLSIYLKLLNIIMSYEICFYLLVSIYWSLDTYIYIIAYLSDVLLLLLQIIKTTVYILTYVYISLISYVLIFVY